MTYKLFLQAPDGARFENKETESRTTAMRTFKNFLQRDDLDGTEVSLHLMHMRTTLAVHRFNAPAGDEYNWNDRVEDISWPSRTGEVGRPAELKKGGRRNVYLDDESVRRAIKLGKGNISEGIRIALARDA